MILVFVFFYIFSTTTGSFLPSSFTLNKDALYFHSYFVVVPHCHSSAVLTRFLFCVVFFVMFYFPNVFTMQENRAHCIKHDRNLQVGKKWKIKIHR